MINLVKKNIIKFEEIIPFLFKQINIGVNKINNLWILLKRSLTIWLFPVFLVSFIFNQNQTAIFNQYILLVSFIYIVVIVVNYLKNNLFILTIDRVLLLFLSFFIYINNKTITGNNLIIVLMLSFCIVLTYVILFFFCKKKGKPFILNFSKLNSFMEFIFVISILIFGINDFIVFNILFILTIDIFYKVLILSIILNLKKRFSIQ